MIRSLLECCVMDSCRVRRSGMTRVRRRCRRRAWITRTYTSESARRASFPRIAWMSPVLRPRMVFVDGNSVILCVCCYSCVSLVVCVTVVCHECFLSQLSSITELVYHNWCITTGVSQLVYHNAQNEDNYFTLFLHVVLCEHLIELFKE